MATPEQRKQECSRRLRTLVIMRESGARKWLIKAEQVALVCNSRGMKAPPLAGKKSDFAQGLYERHVLPVLGIEE
jgi:hypothetical protein